MRRGFPQRWAVSRAAVAIGLLFVAAPALPALASSTRLELWERVVLSTLIFGAICRIESLGRRSLRGVVLASALAFAASGWVVVDADKPNSFYWTLFLLPIFAQGRQLPPKLALWAVTALGPVVVTCVFLARGHSASALSAPLALAAFFPLLYLALAFQAMRRRRVSQERLERETRAAAEREDRARLSVTREVSRAVSADIALARVAADRATQALQLSDAEAASRLTAARAAIGDALHSVRETVWGLDPDAAQWKIIEPHLRRMVADLGPEGSVCSFGVAAGTLVTSEERVALARGVRQALRESTVALLLRVEQGESGFRLSVQPRTPVAEPKPQDHGMPGGQLVT